MTQATDPLGRTTSFTYDASGLLTKITAPGGALGAITGFGYDSSKRVTTITQTESSGTPGNSTTRLLYQDTSTTLMASPTTNQAAAVADVPHTTYTLDSSDRVTNVVDAQGRPQAKTYTANFDTLTSAVGLTGSQSTTTNVYGANGGESLTKSTSQTGASTSIGYTNPSPNQYLPSKGTDDAGNASTYTFNGAGNQLSSSDALAARADVTYNTDGTPATAKSPNNGTNTTKYAYNDKQVAAITPVTGTNLGVRNYTYDQYGRLATSTDGRGVTTTLGYDPNDRLTSVGYSDGTGIAFTYSAAGQLETRTDSTGTTRYGYDQLGRTLLIQNSAFGGTVTYTYDRDSRLATTGNPATGGTVTYHYDPAGKVTSIDYPSGGATKSMVFYTDSHSRRADTWMNANPTHTTWTAHTHNSYDGSDRVSRVTSDVGTGDSSNSRVVDISYCYVFNTTPGSTCTANPTYDRNKLVWKKNNLTGDITAYSYDTSGRLKLATVSGSTAKTFTYTYNANGNRLTAAGTGQTAQTLTFNAANQITTASYTYDGAGNLTAHPKVGGSAATMTYTGDDQLKTVTKSGTTYQYKYGGRGNDELIYQTTPKGTYQYAYGRDDSQGVPTLEQVDKDGQTASVISDPNTGQPLMLNTSSGLQALLVYDGRPGSPIALLTSTGQVGIAYDYNPFGVPTLTTNTNTEVLDQNPYGFATGIQDRTTGWVHYSARYYDPTTAAFTQQDAVDAPLDPTNGNRYAYAGNDPINNTDPAGRRSCAGAVAIAAANYVGFNLAAAGSILIIPTGVGIPIAVGSILLTGVLLAYSFEDAYEACK